MDAGFGDDRNGGHNLKLDRFYNFSRVCFDDFSGSGKHQQNKNNRADPTEIVEYKPQSEANIIPRSGFEIGIFGVPCLSEIIFDESLKVLSIANISVGHSSKKEMTIPLLVWVFRDLVNFEGFLSFEFLVGRVARTIFFWIRSSIRGLIEKVLLGSSWVHLNTASSWKLGLEVFHFCADGMVVVDIFGPLS